MKLHFYLLFACILCAYATTHAQSNKLKKSELPEIFYKRLIGTIGKDEQPIEMNLTKIGSELKGSYFHKLTGQVRNLTGEITEDGYISLQEVDNPKNRLTEPQAVDAVLNVYFTSPKDLKGTWEQIDSLTDVPFDASEMYPVGSAEFDIVQKREKYGDCGYSPCAEFLLIYPVLKNDVHNEDINKKISKTLIDEYDFEEQKTFKNFEEVERDFFKKYIAEESKAKADAKPMWGSHHEVEIVCNVYYILTLEFFSTAYEGAQPTNSIVYLSFDLQTGKTLTLKDILISGYEKELTKIGAEIFKANYGFSDIDDLRKEGFNFKDGKFALNSNYGFTKQGIVFQYNPLEIGANTIGAPCLLIPYSKIKHLLQKECLVMPLVRD